MMDKRNFIALVHENENGKFIGEMPAIRACYAQADTEEDLLKRLRECAIACVNAMTPHELSVLSATGPIQTKQIELEYN